MHRAGSQRRNIYPIPWAVLWLISLVGCGNNPYPPEEPGKKILHLWMSDDPKTLDPSSSLVPDIVDSLYPAYFEYNYLLRNPIRLDLELGATYPVSKPWKLPSGKTGERWTFKLKHGIHFQDDPCFPGGKGREVVASDVIFSLKRLADPNVPAPYFSYVENRVLGLADFSKLNRQRLKQGLATDFGIEVPGLQTDPLDPYTFHIILVEPFPQLKYIMALRCSTPQAPEAWNRYGKELRTHPVGCGPYILKEYLPKQRIVLMPNPNRMYESYPSEGMPGDREAGLLADAGKPLPRNDGIVYSVVRESISSWNLFLQGYEDAWGVGQSNYQSVMSRPGQLSPDMMRRGIKLYRGVIPNVIGFFFNMEDPTFGGYTSKKRKLRQAISLSMNPQKIIDLFTQGTALKAEFLVPPVLTGYDPNYRNPYTGEDLAKAKRLLAEAGYPAGIDPKTGERLTLYFDNAAEEPLSRQFVGLVKRMISRIGINFVSRTWRAVVLADRHSKGQFQFVEWSWFADYPDPEMFLLMLYSPNRRPGMNFAAYHNATVDRLFERIRVMSDSPERVKLIQQLRDIVVEDCPWVYTRHNESLYVTQPWMLNRKQPQVDADMAKYWSVDPYQRERAVQNWNRPAVTPLIWIGFLLVIGSIPAIVTARQRATKTARDRNKT